MFRIGSPITPDLSPNVTWRDLVFATGQLVNPIAWRKWIHGTSNSRLERFFMETYRVDFARTFDSGRTALTAVLGGAIQQGDRVYIQAFTCIAVPNAVKAAGGVPIYVDIDDTLNLDPQDLKKKIEQHGKPAAVVVQHQFGYPAQMKPIQAICNEHGALLIEDCAHAFGSYTAEGELVGTIGDAAMFSFGRDKPISCVSGGAAITKNPALGKSINVFWEQLPYPPRIWIAQRFNHPLIFAVAKPLYHFFSVGKIIVYISKRTGLFPLVLKRSEKDGSQAEGARMPNVLALWTLKQIEQLPTMNQHRAAMAALYATYIQEHASDFVQVEQPQQPVDGQSISYLRYSLLVDNSVDLLKTVRSQGILLGDWYRTVIAPKDASYDSVGYSLGSCPRAEVAAERVVNLPTNIRTSERQATRAIEAVGAFYSSKK